MCLCNNNVCGFKLRSHDATDAMSAWVQAASDTVGELSTFYRSYLATVGSMCRGSDD